MLYLNRFIKALTIFFAITLSIQAYGFERPVERGHEVQNGDWSVVYRAEQIISEAKALLKWQVRYGQWQLPEHREKFKEVFRSRSEVDQFFEFLERVKIPGFETLGEFLPCQLFCQLNVLFFSYSFDEDNGYFYFSPNFLRQVGRQNNTELEKIDYIYETQLHILTKFVLYIQGLSQYHWIYPMENVRTFINVNQFVDETIFTKIDTLDVEDENQSIDENILKKVVNYGVFKNILNLDISYTPTVNIELSKNFYVFDRANINPIDKLKVAIHNIKLNFIKEDSTEITQGFNIYLKLSRADHKDNNSLDIQSYYLDLKSIYFDFKIPIPGWYDYHLATVKDTEPFLYTFNKAVRILKEAQSYLVIHLENQSIKEIVTRVEPLEYSEYLRAEVKLKNFDYDSSSHKVITTKSFYQRFGYYQNAVTQQIMIDKVKRMLIHEALHLLGYNESESLDVSNEMIHKMQLKEGNNTIRMLIGKDGVFVQDLLQTHHKSAVADLVKFLDEGFDGDYKVSLGKSVWECYLDTNQKSCDQEISDLIVKQQIRFMPKIAGVMDESIVHNVSMKYSFINSFGNSGHIEFFSPKGQFEIREQVVQTPEMMDVIFSSFEHTKEKLYIEAVCENEEYSLTGKFINQPFSVDSNSWVKDVKLLRSPYVGSNDLPLQLKRNNFERSLTVSGREVGIKSELWSVDKQFLNPMGHSLSFGFSYDYRVLRATYTNEAGEKAFGKLICRPLN